MPITGRNTSTRITTRSLTMRFVRPGKNNEALPHWSTGASNIRVCSTGVFRFGFDSLRFIEQQYERFFPAKRRIDALQNFKSRGAFRIQFGIFQEYMHDSLHAPANRSVGVVNSSAEFPLH